MNDHDRQSPASDEVEVTAFYERPRAIGWRRASAAAVILVISAAVVAIDLGSSGGARSHPHLPSVTPVPSVTAAPISDRGPMMVKSEMVETRIAGRDPDADDP
jgi:hypothetical protein